MPLALRWVSIRQAKAFIRQHHRHRPKLAGGIVALGAFDSGCLVAVAVLGRPSARRDQEAGKCEITRLCSDGTRNACSALYAKAKRLAQALGFNGGTKTFTLCDEPGATLRAVGATEEGLTDGGSWSRDGRPRTDSDTGRKRRWAL